MLGYIANDSKTEKYPDRCENFTIVQNVVRADQTSRVFFVFKNAQNSNMLYEKELKK